MDMFFEVLGFAAKGFVVFVTIAVTAAVVFGLSRKRRGGGGSSLEVRKLNARFEALGDSLRAGMLGRKESKAFLKTRAKQKEAAAEAPERKPSVYVLDFEGDLLATAVTSLREEVSAITEVAAAGDEVVVRLESPGGAVPHYGLAAAQLVRLREKKVKVTVCVDRVAASGGYMMACVADRIVAAPFSIVGSIGVVAQVPNVHRLLKKYDVDYEEMTAGEFKRTVSVFGEITAKGRQKFTAQLEETHALFKDFIHAQRPALNLDLVATGEYWLGTRALTLGLIDQLGTSDAYLMQRTAEANVYGVKYTPANSWRQRLGRVAAEVAERVLVTVMGRLRAFELP